MPIQFHERSLTGPATSPAIRLSKDVDELSRLIGIVVTGTVTYDIEFSMDARVAFENSGETGAQWFKLADMVGLTTTQYTKIDMPVSGIRLVITAGSGTAVLKVNQFSKG